MKELRLEHITKTFSLSKKQARNRGVASLKKVAVNDLSLTLLPGETYGLLGPNGAGKTTTLRILSSLIKPDSGYIKVDGQDVYLDLRAYRQRIGFLTSELKLDDFFTPEYTFTYMCSLYGIPKEQALSKMNELFAHFGITSFKDIKIKELSTGMKQKVSLAISLCHDPDIIIFDEPTNGLDIISSKDVEDFLVEMKKEGKTIIISTHIFSILEKLCDRIGVIIDGNLVSDMPLKKFVGKGSLEEAFFKVYEGK